MDSMFLSYLSRLHRSPTTFQPVLSSRNRLCKVINYLRREDISLSFFLTRWSFEVGSPFWHIECAGLFFCWGSADCSWQLSSSSSAPGWGQRLLKIFTCCPWTLCISRSSKVLLRHRCTIYLWRESGKRSYLWWYRCQLSFWQVRRSFWRHIACLSDAFQQVGCCLPTIFDISAVSIRIVWWCLRSRFRAFWFLGGGNGTFFIVLFHLLGVFLLNYLSATFWISCSL